MSSKSNTIKLFIKFFIVFDNSRCSKELKFGIDLELFLKSALKSIKVFTFFVVDTFSFTKTVDEQLHMIYNLKILILSKFTYALFVVWWSFKIIEWTDRAYKDWIFIKTLCNASVTYSFNSLLWLYSFDSFLCFAKPTFVQSSNFNKLCFFILSNNLNPVTKSE